MYNNYYIDMAIIYNNELPQDMYQKGNKKKHKNIRVLNEVKFLQLMNKGLNDQAWKRINFIQTWLKTKIGIGKKLIINFFAKINKK